MCVCGGGGGGVREPQGRIGGSQFFVSFAARNSTPAKALTQRSWWERNEELTCGARASFWHTTGLWWLPNSVP